MTGSGRSERARAASTAAPGRVWNGGGMTADDPSRAREGRHRVPDAGGGTASTSPTGVLAAVVAAVRANPGLMPGIAAHVRVEGGVEAGRADVADALVCLHLVGAVTKGPGGRWLPGAWSLEDLPLPLATLERDWQRERRKRVKHARYE